MLSHFPKASQLVSGGGWKVNNAPLIPKAVFPYLHYASHVFKKTNLSLGKLWSQPGLFSYLHKIYLHEVGASETSPLRCLFLNWSPAGPTVCLMKYISFWNTYSISNSLSTWLFLLGVTSQYSRRMVTMYINDLSPRRLFSKKVYFRSL